jgi:hypothetical protein
MYVSHFKIVISEECYVNAVAQTGDYSKLIMQQSYTSKHNQFEIRERA